MIKSRPLTSEINMNRMVIALQLFVIEASPGELQKPL